MTQGSDDLVQDLWARRRSAEGLPATTLSSEEGFSVLVALTERALSVGDAIIGWKITRLVAENSHDFLFAAPVFASSLEHDTSHALVHPLVEVEFVALVRKDGQVRPGEAEIEFSWQLGLEIVDNHDPGWNLDVGWTIADWGLHAAAVIGESCAEPLGSDEFTVHLRIGEKLRTRRAPRKFSHQQLLSVLARDCPRFGRALLPGDYVWTGSLVAPRPFSIGDRLEASVEGYGSVSLS